MPKFQFYLADFKITNTRSYRNDTLIAGLGIAVNGTVVAIQVAQMGDFDNGTFQPWQHKLNALNGILINPTDKVTFMYQFYNNGHSHHPNAGELTTAIRKDINTMLIQVPNHDPNEIWSDGNFSDEVTTAIFTGGLYELFKSIYGGCDGIVAGYGVSLVGQDLENSIESAPGHLLKVSNAFNAGALNYNKPCNPHGSNYIVTWLAQHQP